MSMESRRARRGHTLEQCLVIFRWNTLPALEFAGHEYSFIRDSTKADILDTIPWIDGRRNVKKGPRLCTQACNDQIRSASDDSSGRIWP